MIPKKIHYCWFGGKPIPNELKKCIKSWKEKCPDYEIVRWDESNFDIHCNRFVEDAYNNKSWAFVSDYARLKIIYDNGGIYLDTDVELLKRIDCLLENDSFFGFQQADYQINTGLGFGAIKNNALVKKMLDIYDTIVFDKENRTSFICPILNTKVILDSGFKICDEIQIIDNNIVYPARYFDPIAPGDSKNLLCNDTISIHHYSATWMKKKYQFKRQIINFLGQDRINKIKIIIRGNKK